MRPFASPTLLSPRTPPLALRNVMQGGVRSLMAIAGVGFSITLVLLQLGFLEAVRITATSRSSPKIRMRSRRSASGL